MSCSYDPSKDSDASACPVNHDKPKDNPLVNPLNQMPTDLEGKSPGGLSREREISSIPMGGDRGNWIYPSEEMFFNAMKRKNWTPEERGGFGSVYWIDMHTIIPIHNAVNEQCWKEILKWESMHKTACSTPKLLKFQGRPKDYTIKARFKQLFGYKLPFDRHDWTVDRCGESVRYIIDFYSGAPKEGKPASFYLDVRPAVTPVGIRDRFFLQCPDESAVVDTDQHALSSPYVAVQLVFACVGLAIQAAAAFRAVAKTRKRPWVPSSVVLVASQFVCVFGFLPLLIAYSIPSSPPAEVQQQALAAVLLRLSALLGGLGQAVTLVLVLYVFSLHSELARIPTLAYYFLIGFFYFSTSLFPSVLAPLLFPSFSFSKLERVWLLFFLLATTCTTLLLYIDCLLLVTTPSSPHPSRQQNTPKQFGARVIVLAVSASIFLTSIGSNVFAGYEQDLVFSAASPLISVVLLGVVSLVSSLDDRDDSRASPLRRDSVGQSIAESITSMYTDYAFEAKPSGWRESQRPSERYSLYATQERKRLSKEFLSVNLGRGTERSRDDSESWFDGASRSSQEIKRRYYFE
ncbi:hypothetical protein HDU91_007069 [Kappamyces sp. JEL0680]|nr:hypothetical protein HDU91_007069 [Kappamyces sp. JEL0680]